VANEDGCSADWEYNVGGVLVVGSLNMDVVAQSERHPHYGETVLGSTVSLIPGGKGANQAVAASRAGASTIFVGAVGTDAFGDSLLSFLCAADLSTDLIAQVHGSSGTAIVLVDKDGGNSIVVIPGANSMLSPTAAYAAALAAGDVVLLQNEVRDEVNAATVEYALQRSALTVFNLAPFTALDVELLAAVDYLVVNETEFAQLLGESTSSMPPHRITGLLAEGVGHAKNVVVTLGADGLSARIGKSATRIPGHTVTAVDTTGAGDCFCGAFGAALARGLEPERALRYANAAAAISVRTLGAGPSMPNRADIERFLNP
jgi:ribokinase